MPNKKQVIIIVVFGPPGSGKGTQAELMAQKYGFYHLITGNLIREVKEQKTALGRQVKVFYQKGIPQPDELVIRMVRKKVASILPQKGIIFDVFPLSAGQIKGLEQICRQFKLNLPWVIYIDLSSQSVLRRLIARKFCQKCGATYLPSMTAYKKNQCKKCKGKLIIRTDDKPETIKKRIKEFKNRIKPIIAYYQQKNRLIKINGEPPIKQVAKEIDCQLKNKGIVK